jgi:hypothetical protein
VPEPEPHKTFLQEVDPGSHKNCVALKHRSVRVRGPCEVTILYLLPTGILYYAILQYTIFGKMIFGLP